MRHRVIAIQKLKLNAKRQIGPKKIALPAGTV
jgi:hypothetical protein